MARKAPAPRSSRDEVRAGLFAGVKAEPDSDEPRLVLADWLDDHGDADDHAHAALIRTQCAGMGRMAELIDPQQPGPIHALLRSAANNNESLLPYDFRPSPDPDPELAELRRTEGELIRRLGERQLPGLSFKHRVEWHRGFAYLSLGNERGSSRELAAFAAGPAGPRVESLDLYVTPSSVATIARNDLLAHAVGLRFHGPKAGAAELATLLASPHLDQLRRLDLGQSARHDKVTAVAQSRQCGRLTHLYLFSSRGEPDALRTLAAADLSALRALHLAETDAMGPQGAKLLAAAPFLAHLQELALTYCGLGAAGIEALISGPHFRCPALLEVGSNALGMAGLRTLLAAPGLEEVVVLELHNNGLDDAAIAGLVGSPRLAGLLALDLCGNPIGPAGVEALASSPHLGRLASLDLRCDGSGEAGARALLASPHLRRLYLSVLGDGLSPETLNALRERYFLRIVR